MSRVKDVIKAKSSVVVLCEAGWRDIRELSLELARRNIDTFVLIKGDPGREVRNFISRYKLIHNYFIPRWMYRVQLLSFVIFFRFAKKAKVCFWTNPRTERLLAPYCAVAGLKLMQLVEEGNRLPVEKMNRNIRNTCSAIEDLIK